MLAVSGGASGASGSGSSNNRFYLPSVVAGLAIASDDDHNHDDDDDHHHDDDDNHDCGCSGGFSIVAADGRINVWCANRHCAGGDARALCSRHRSTTTASGRGFVVVAGYHRICIGIGGGGVGRHRKVGRGLKEAHNDRV